jgi:UDP-GlcNAc:undecaprenyl-phosphate GlcNAc-1-phosphate transferase
MIELLSVLICAFVLLFFLTRKAHKWGLLDLPGHRKYQFQPVPRIGGLSFFLPFLFITIFFKQQWSWSFFLGASIIFIGGFYDDLGKIHRAREKLFFQILGGGIFAIFFPLIGVDFELQLAIRSITFLVILAMTNSFNLMDNMNGLTSGLTLIILTGFYFTIQNGQNGITHNELAQTSLLVLILGLLPFFLLNFPAGKVFMGDQGSQFLGFVVPAIFFELNFSAKENINLHYVWQGLTTLLIILLLFVLDTSLVIWIRTREGRSIFIGDQCHLSHQLHRRGFSKIAVAVFLFLIQAGLVFLSGRMMGLKLFL